MKKFEAPELLVECFEVEDVITASTQEIPASVDEYTTFTA